MIQLKTDREMEIMIEGGKRLQQVVADLRPQIKVGMTTEEVDNLAEVLIHRYGGEPSFKKVYGYRWSTCLPINEQVVHTPPSKRTIKDGDILTLDIGLYFKGFHTDYADTFVVGQTVDRKVRHFLDVGRHTLKKAIAAARVDKYIGEISEVIASEMDRNHFFVMKELTGHGIGRDLHEEPYVPGYRENNIKKTYRIKPGLMLAIEIIYSMGTEQIKHEKRNDWSIATRDGSISACYEHTVACRKDKTIVIT